MPAACGFVTLGRRIVPGMEELVAGICADMAILAAVCYAHFLMTVHATDVKSCFQPHFVAVKQSVVSINSVKIFSFKPVTCMAALAGNFVSATTFRMAAQAVFIFDFCAKCVVMAYCTVTFSNLLMHRMVKNYRFIELRQGVDYNLIRSFTG